MTSPSISTRRLWPALPAVLSVTPALAEEPTHGGIRVSKQWSESPRIVNGVTSVVDPSTVALVTQGGSQFCSGTLVGCRTVLTASHCVCNSPHAGPDCQDGSVHQRPPGSFFVFAQHGGLIPVVDVDVPWAYQFQVDADVEAVLQDARSTEQCAEERRTDALANG